LLHEGSQNATVPVHSPAPANLPSAPCRTQVSSVRLREELVEAEALGQRMLLPGPLARTRQLFITYLDDELLVIRDESGVPDILMRKQMFYGEDVGERSFADDDSSPGAS